MINQDKDDQERRSLLDQLRREIMHHKEKRASFVLQKLTFVVGLFGAGSIRFPPEVDLSLLLYAIPLVALAYDVYISAEDYKVKRIGHFLRTSEYASEYERKWEEYVDVRREPLAAWASLLLTLITTLSSAGVIYSLKREVSWWLAIWLTCSLLATGLVSLYYKWLLEQLDIKTSFRPPFFRWLLKLLRW
jgi:hypothetical protein